MDADRMQLVHIFRLGQQTPHRPERLVSEIEVEAGDYHLYAAVCQLVAQFHDRVVEEMDFVYPNHVHMPASLYLCFYPMSYPLDSPFGDRHRYRFERQPTVRPQFDVVISVVQVRFESEYVLLSYLGPDEPPYQLLGLSRKHAAGYDFYPAEFFTHGYPNY